MTQASIVPESYAAWRHCIEVDCGLRLDIDYVNQRIAALANAADFQTQQFVRCWGEAHRQRVIGWFRRARDEAQTRDRS